MANLNHPQVPEGVVTEIVAMSTRRVRVRTQRYGVIEMYMASLDDVDVGDRVLVIPLPGGKVVAAIQNLEGLGDFENVGRCVNVVRR